MPTRPSSRLAALEVSQAPTLDDAARAALLDEAIAAFHTLLIADPRLLRVRLELARAFYFKGEDELARRHFEHVLVGGVPEPVTANVQDFLNEIRARERWRFNLGFALAPDSNIGSASAERTIFIRLGGFELPFPPRPAGADHLGHRRLGVGRRGVSGADGRPDAPARRRGGSAAGV